MNTLLPSSILIDISEMIAYIEKMLWLLVFYFVLLL